jgi:uncharacterized protein
MNISPSLKWLLILIAFSGSASALAGGFALHSNGLIEAERQEVPAGYLGRIELGDPAAVEGALARAERFYFKESANKETYSPVVLVIHGSEVGIFFKENYEMYKSIVDLAARLSAFNVIDIRVCETSARGLGLDLKTLFPFVDTVVYGPAEVVRLIDVEKYQYF